MYICVHVCIRSCLWRSEDRSCCSLSIMLIPKLSGCLQTLYLLAIVLSHSVILWMKELRLKEVGFCLELLAHSSSVARIEFYYKSVAFILIIQPCHIFLLLIMSDSIQLFFFSCGFSKITSSANLVIYVTIHFKRSLGKG